MADEFRNHTPGPWALMAHIPTNVLDSGGLRVARCDFDGDMDSPEAHANARLIAAAPDLLAERDAARSRIEALTKALREAADALQSIANVQVDVPQLVRGFASLEADAARKALASAAGAEGKPG